MKRLWLLLLLPLIALAQQTGPFGPEITVTTPSVISDDSPFEEKFNFSPAAGLIHGTNRTVISTNAQLETYRIKRNAFNTAGDAHVYLVNPTVSDFTRDLVIDLRGQSEIKIPILMGRWRNIYLIGIGWDLDLQLAGYDGGTAVADVAVGNGRFQLQNKPFGTFTVGRTVQQATSHSSTDGYPTVNNPTVDAHRNTTLGSDGYAGTGGWNIHPRIAGLAPVEVENSHTLYMEGCYIKANGQQGDMFIISNNGTGAAAATNRKIYLQAVYAEGSEGQGDDPLYGDGIHGDYIHHQGNDSAKPYGFWIDHNWISVGQNGMSITGGGGFANTTETHVYDTQFIESDAWEITHPSITTGDNAGGKSFGWTRTYPYDNSKWTVDNVWYEGKAHAFRFSGNNVDIVAIGDNTGSSRIGHAGAHKGISTPLTNLIVEADLGPNYVRPTNRNGGATHTLGYQ